MHRFCAPLVSFEDVRAACSLLATSRIKIDAPDLKEASVCVAITAGERLEIILIERSADLRAHSGQWALPGGRRDRGETPEATALRELREELGIVVGPPDVLGRLDDYQTRSGYVISPFVIRCGPEVKIQPNRQEVAAVFSIGLSDLLSHDRFVWFEIAETGRLSVKMSVRGGFLYAPAAAVLFQLRELMCGRLIRVLEIDQPTFTWS